MKKRVEKLERRTEKQNGKVIVSMDGIITYQGKEYPSHKELLKLHPETKGAMMVEVEFVSADKIMRKS